MTASRSLKAQAWIARRACRTLPPFLSYRMHFRFFDHLRGQTLAFRERVLFGKGVLKGTFENTEDAYFALHGTMNYLGMVIAAALVEPGDTVYELGANRATETLSLANLVTGNGRVVAVEADPETARILRDRVESRPEVLIVQRAVAHVSGTMSWTRNEQATGCSFLSVGANGTVIVETTTVDDLARELGPPAFIFMDIEGSELLCLRGAAETLRRHRPPIFSEVNDAHLRRAGASVQELWQLIDESGYVAFDAQRRAFPLVGRESAVHGTSSDWLLLPRERAGEAIRLRRLLRRARFLPRLAGLNPLEERR